MELQELIRSFLGCTDTFPSSHSSLREYFRQIVLLLHTRHVEPQKDYPLLTNCPVFLPDIHFQFFYQIEFIAPTEKFPIQKPWVTAFCRNWNIEIFLIVSPDGKPLFGVAFIRITPVDIQSGAD